MALSDYNLFARVSSQLIRNKHREKGPNTWLLSAWGNSRVDR
jgi:hypothetical protein